MTKVETWSEEFVQTSAGLALIACSAAGVAAVLLGDDEASLMAELRERFPGVTHRTASAATREIAEQVRASIDGAEGIDIELDLRGTPFQRLVWAELCRIPPGTTATYSEIAQRIGRPASVRAVAGACAANAHAVLIPCHRVVRSDGTASGYRWGATRKQLLLAREQQLPALTPSRASP